MSTNGWYQKTETFKTRSKLPPALPIVDREKLCREIDLAEKKHAKEFPALQKAAATAKAEVEAMKAALKEGERKLLEVENALRSATAQKDATRNRNEAQLIQNADPLIQEFCWVLLDLRDEALRIRPETETAFNRVRSGDQIWMPVSTNLNSIRRRLTAINEAFQAAQALRTSPLSGAALTAELDRLWDTIPAVEFEPCEKRVSPVEHLKEALNV